MLVVVVVMMDPQDLFVGGNNRLHREVLEESFDVMTDMRTYVLMSPEKFDHEYWIHLS